MADLTSERLAELRRIAKDATPGPWAFPHQKDPYGCYLLPLSENNASYIAVFDPTTTLALLDRIEALEQERDAARAEAERWRNRYEALRAGVERILKQIEAAPKPEEFIPTNPDEMMAELLYAMKGGKGHNKGFANGLWVAGMMLRGLLAEAGGDGNGPSRQDQKTAP